MCLAVSVNVQPRHTPPSKKKEELTNPSRFLLQTDAVGRTDRTDEPLSRRRAHATRRILPDKYMREKSWAAMLSRGMLCRASLPVLWEGS